VQGVLGAGALLLDTLAFMGFRFAALRVGLACGAPE
jgi:hypothetical protein